MDDWVCECTGGMRIGEGKGQRGSGLERDDLWSWKGEDPSLPIAETPWQTSAGWGRRSSGGGEPDRFLRNAARRRVNGEEMGLKEEWSEDRREGCMGWGKEEGREEEEGTEGDEKREGKPARILVVKQMSLQLGIFAVTSPFAGHTQVRVG